MKIKDIMTNDVRTCTRDTTVAEAARLMWDGDCGILPIVDQGVLVGVVTDRDLFIALSTRDARPSELRVGEVTSDMPVACAPDDDVHVALATMRLARIRRIPVVAGGNVVAGMLSMNDILLAAGDGRDVRAEHILGALQAICGHGPCVADVVAA